MISFLKKHLSVKYTRLIVILVSLLSQQTYAVGLSTYRIKLDNKNTETEFLVYNKSIIAQQCSITLIDIDYNEYGERISNKESDFRDISAKRLLKYSPKNFELKGHSSQSIRFNYRRKRTSTPQEFRSYLSLMCNNMLDDTTAELQINVKPNLRINIPIIVRTGDIPVEVTFSKVSYVNNKLTIEVTKKGERSIYGYLNVVDKTSGETIHSQKAFSLHAEVTKNTHEATLKNLDISNVEIQFIEDVKLSGELKIIQ